MDNHTNLTCYGVVQLFDQPHPKQLLGPGFSLYEAPNIAPSKQNIIEMAACDKDVSDLVLEATACEGHWTSEKVSSVDDDLEQGTEALDALGSAGKNSDPATIPSLQIGSVGSFSSETRAPPVKSNRQYKGVSDENGGKISLPEGFNPIQALEELEKLDNFLVQGLHSTILPVKESQKKLPLSLLDFFERDIQALGVMMAEIIFAPKIHTTAPKAPMQERFSLVRNLCRHHVKEIPNPLLQMLESLLQIHVPDDDIFFSGMNLEEQVKLPPNFEWSSFTLSLTAP